MNFLWLVYTDDAGVVETAGVFSTSEKAGMVAAQCTDITGLQWGVRMLPSLDSNWEID
jgi:hypothetical protein